MPPAASKSGASLFLGLELATDQLRASLVDENLELVGVECVDFDTELPEFQTQGGIFTTPGEAYTTPVDMFVKALDFLLEKLHNNYDLSRIRALGGSAQHALIWWKSSPIPSFPALDPRLPLYSQITAQTFSLPNTPVAQDTSAHTHALALEAALGGPDHMAARVGICASPALIAAQLLRVREAAPEIWGSTGRVQVASAFLASLVCAQWVPISEAEACATGMWLHGKGDWDDGVLDIVGGSREDGRKIRGWMGEVDVVGCGRRVGTVSRYLVERYGFDADTTVTAFIPDYLSLYLSLTPSSTDAVLAFGPMDMLMTTAQHYIPTRLYNLYPHPAQDPNEKKKYVVTLTNRNADVPRALVRDMYTKSWSAFDRLVAIVPPGGSIGLDDKLFSFWLLQADSCPFSHVKGIFRFETGVKVNEFRDLRANPRCLIESQILSFRVRWSRMLATGVLGTQPQPPPLSASLGVSFDPYDPAPLPARVIATGAAANFPSIANVVGDVFNAPVCMPATQIDSAQASPHRNAPAGGFPSRAALGGAYIARWAWGRGARGYEEEIRRLLLKRWAANGGAAARTNAVGVPSSVAVAASGYGPGRASGLGASVVVEEDEDEVLLVGHEERMRTLTSSTNFSGSASVSGAAPSTAFTTPDPNGATPAGTTSLVPVTALPSTGEGELQLGLGRVAEADVDAFMAYASLVPEYCRLEGMLMKGLV
ncbi:actin-like ATPase domain-containing protein [Neolentinus lepideus HHB14362 ss-1]|uniref:Actin-like ATPase domain-containing protein n=1 Tax=Neolentinus lepideus HHB14362 ss-1 TaxID=1314782 RepID=A0A165VQN4_9AGAM|nr:actin-like ATPase domain-containing protein [Neolentinus lepideus HHB14362 ss-1]